MAGPISELDALGVKYHMHYGASRSHYVDKVCIPWSPAQWVGVLHREGQWLGACCGTISSIRDRLMQALADGGWVSMGDLASIIELMRSHDGFSDWFEDEFSPVEDNLADPLYLLARIWAVVKTRRWASWLDVPAKKTPERRVETSGRTLERALEYSNIVGMYHPGDYEDPAAMARAEFRHNRDVMTALARVIPALKLFTESLEGRIPQPIRGCAIVRKDDREVVLDTIGGPAIYQSEDEANEVLGYWCTNDQKRQEEDPPKREDFEVRPVQVSVDSGVAFTT